MHFVNEPWLVTAVLLLIVVPLTWKLGNWKGKTDADVSALKENVDRLILRMDHFIATFSGRAKGGVAGSQSPVSLNAYGKKLAKKIDAAEIVDAFAARADAETKGMNAYQIQERCVTFSLRVVLEELKHHDKPRFDRVAEVAFNEWIMIEKIAYVIALLLCDRILQMRGMARANANAEAGVSC